MQKAYFNDGDIKEGNLTEAAKAAGFKYGRTVVYDDKVNAISTTSINTTNSRQYNICATIQRTLVDRINVYC